MFCSQLFLDEDDGRFSVSEDGSLVIERVVNADAGEYICEAQSPAGSAFAKTKLDVRGIHPSIDLSLKTSRSPLFILC